MLPTTLHLRSETKPLERRSPLSPATAIDLLQAGYIVNVEKSQGRIYSDDEFVAVGVNLVPEGSWVNAPSGNIILGLKELPEDDSPLRHAHIQFGHCYKKQEGSDRYLSRFARGNGLLYDIEFLTGADGRRVAAFGYYAGYAGAAIALLAWSHQLLHPGTLLGPIPLFASASALVQSVKTSVLEALPKNATQPPRIIVIGARGRCGTGAVDLCKSAGVPIDSILQWDMEETAAGGPFSEVSSSDIFINCVYLGATPIPPFTTLKSLSEPGRKLRVICDVSADPNNPNNPIPVYTKYSTFTKPTLPVAVDGDGPELTVISIDHLPSLVAREASDEFSASLLPSLMVLDRRKSEGVWTRAENIYREKVAELQDEKRSS
ncbi:alanine dehydrogenase [Camillea tinctor]|nr:alanine dehydrogenase [Camillea tinctor]